MAGHRVIGLPRTATTCPHARKFLNGPPVRADLAAVFVALVLTAMQVGLATERLQRNATFQQ